VSVQPVIIEVWQDRTAWVRGPSHVVHPILRKVRCPRRYDPQRRAMAIPVSFVDDVKAALELQAGAEVRVELVVA
jgi:hypothetical protein